MNIQILSYFKTVYEELNIQKAADRLFLSRQTLSNDISRLEKELDVKLFNRLNNGLEVTPEGQLVYENISQMLQIWQNTYESLHPSPHTESEIPIAINSFILWGFSDLFTAFEEAHPEISLQLNSLDMQECFQMISSGDTLCTIEPFEEQSSIIKSTLLAEVPRCIFVHRKNPLAALSSIGQEDLAGQTLLSHSNEETILRVLSINNLPKGCSIRHIPNDQNYLNHLLSRNSGIFTACGHIDLLLSNPDLVCLPCRGSLSTVSIYLLERKDKRISKAALRLRDYVLRAYDWSGQGNKYDWVEQKHL